MSVVEQTVADKVGVLTFSATESGSTTRKIVGEEGDGDLTIKVAATMLGAYWSEHGNLSVRGLVAR